MFRHGDAILRESFRSKEYNDDDDDNNNNNNNNNMQCMNNIKTSYLILGRTDDYRQSN